MANKFIRNIKIEADAQGDLPKSIQLLHVGSWNTPWHGDFEITEGDINQFVENYEANVGLPEDSDGKIQINYGHWSSGKAAGWLTNLRAERVDGVLSLIGDPEWTPEGAKALADQEYRYISPEFNPRALPWEDPEEEWRMVANVLTGAGLTNIPLFKKLKKVAASERPSSSNKPNEGDEPMKFKLEEVRKLEASALSDEQRAFLEANKADLTDAERDTFGIKADEDPASKTTVNGDTKDQVTISADELAKLQADAAQGVEAAQKLAQKEASDFASARIAAGQVKSDQKDALTAILLASRGDDRTKLESFLEGLPVNDRIGTSLGEDGKAVAGSAYVEVKEKTEAKIKASADEGKALSYAEARKQVLAADASLKERLTNEQEGDK